MGASGGGGLVLAVPGDCSAGTPVSSLNAVVATYSPAESFVPLVVYTTPEINGAFPLVALYIGYAVRPWPTWVLNDIIALKCQQCVHYT